MSVSEYGIRQIRTMRDVIQRFYSGTINIGQLYGNLEALRHILDCESPNGILPIDEINELEVLNALRIEHMISKEELDDSTKSITRGIYERLIQYLASIEQLEP